MRKIISVFLIFSVLLCLFSCKGNDDGGNDTSGQVSRDDGEEVYYLDTLKKHDDGGNDFRILATTQLERFYEQDNASSVVVDNAAFKRNVSVEQLFNTKLSHTFMDGNSSGSADFSTEIRISTMSGDYVYDLIIGQNYYTLPLVSEGIFQNLMGSGNFNWEKPWYHKTINQGGTVNGKLWGASGSYVISQLAYATACFYSKTVYEESNFEYDLYDLVRKGQWTYEIFLELVASYDAMQQTDSTRRYGLIKYDHAVHATVIGMGVEFVGHDSDGNWSLDEFYTPQLEDIYEKIRALFNNYPNAVKQSADMEAELGISRGSLMSRTLFVQAWVDGILTDELLMPNGSFSIGVLPQPKLDIEQSEYRTRVMREELFFVPTGADLDRSALFTDALNFVTYDILNEAYWETALELRSSDTSEDMEMLEIISNTVYKDAGQYFSENLENLPVEFGNEILKNKASFSTWWYGHKKAITRQLGLLSEIYK